MLRIRCVTKIIYCFGPNNKHHIIYSLGKKRNENYNLISDTKFRYKIFQNNYSIFIKLKKKIVQIMMGNRI